MQPDFHADRAAGASDVIEFFLAVRGCGQVGSELLRPRVKMR